MGLRPGYQARYSVYTISVAPSLQCRALLMLASQWLPRVRPEGLAPLGVGSLELGAPATCRRLVAWWSVMVSRCWLVLA